MKVNAEARAAASEVVDTYIGVVVEFGLRANGKEIISDARNADR